MGNDTAVVAADAALDAEGENRTFYCMEDIKVHVRQEQNSNKDKFDL